ncbi:MAG TPA: rRNA maturation RNase YbeY [Candidatus Limnocylindrales bacterium]
MRSIYLPPWRVDIDRRPRVPRVVPDARLARAVATALDAAGAPSPASVGLRLSDDRELAGLNAEHMGQSGPTDVLSFPILPPEAFPRRGARTRSRPPSFPLPPGARQPLGDIVVSVARAIAQASDGRGGQTGDVRWSAADELLLLVTHGALHLCGWDHARPADEAAMRSLERRLLGLGARRRL